MGSSRELLLRLAIYNRDSNREMLELVAARLPTPWEFSLKGYHFKFLGEILDHCYIVDINWMDHLRHSSRDIILSGLERGTLDPNAEHFKDFTTFREARSALDQKIVDFFQLVDDASLVTNTVEGPEGRTVPWLPALHLFNHQTHHRGQICHILDGQNIENDYSSLIRI